MRTDKETLSLEEVQVVQLSVDLIQAAVDTIRKSNSLSHRRKLALCVSATRNIS